MKIINVQEVTKTVQDRVNNGTLTFDCLVFHTETGSYSVGDPADILSVWNLIKAYENRGKNTSKL